LGRTLDWANKDGLAWYGTKNLRYIIIVWCGHDAERGENRITLSSINGKFYSGRNIGHLASDNGKCWSSQKDTVMSTAWALPKALRMASVVQLGALI